MTNRTICAQSLLRIRYWSSLKAPSGSLSQIKQFPMTSTLCCVGTGSRSKACVTHTWFCSPAEMSDVNLSAPLPSWPIVWQIFSSCLLVALLRFPTSAMWNTGKDPDLSSHPAFVLALLGMLMIVQIFAQNFLFRYCWKSRQSAVPDHTDQTMASIFLFLFDIFFNVKKWLQSHRPTFKLLPFLKAYYTFVVPCCLKNVANLLFRYSIFWSDGDKMKRTLLWLAMESPNGGKTWISPVPDCSKVKLLKTSSYVRIAFVNIIPESHSYLHFKQRYQWQRNARLSLVSFYQEDKELTEMCSVFFCFVLFFSQSQHEGSNPLGSGLGYLQHICQLIEKIGQLQETNLQLQRQICSLQKSSRMTKTKEVLNWFFPLGLCWYVLCSKP